LAETSNQLEPLEAELTEHVEDFIVGLWTAHVEMGEKHPPEETRKALAHRAFDRDKYRSDPHPARRARPREGPAQRSERDRRGAALDRVGRQDGTRGDRRPATALVAIGWVTRSSAESADA
jgi:hypothetical protein